MPDVVIEAGRPMTDQQALQILVRANEWIERYGSGECECGSCFACAYRHVAKRLLGQNWRDSIVFRKFHPPDPQHDL